jgi:phospholipid/cholesterol/gamma-HCH transport system ATP-binding protein
MNSELAIDISNLCMAFDGPDLVLDHLDLKIPKGEITVIIGFSGSGKSVLLKLILGLLKPTSGSIKVLGEEITTMNDEQLHVLRRHYGMLFQDSALFDMTALDNVVFPLTEHRRDLTEAQKIQIAKARLNDAGLDAKHYLKMPSEMSGGMRKRVGLARALALEPEILIYDEPTTSLDPVLTEVIDDLIVSTENSRQGTTSIVVSHELFGAFKMANSVAMLHAGKVLLFGTPADFLVSKNLLVKEFISKGLHQNQKCESY